jgi:hypothetical protein
LHALRTALALTVLATAPALPAAAAAETLGSLSLPAGGFGSYCVSACTAFQGQVSPSPPGTYTLRATAPGTITAWRFRNGNVQAGNRFALRVLRPADVGETSFTVVGSTDAQTVPDNADAVRGPYPAALAVQPGDRIGLRALGPSDFGVPVAVTGQNDPVTGDGARAYFTDPADGAGGVPSDMGTTGQQVLVQAEVDAPPPPPPPPLPPPDFSLALLGNVPAGNRYAMDRTGSLELPLAVRRSDLSRGGIRLSVSGLPAGLTGSFAATELDGVGEVADTLTIRRPRGFPLAPPPVPGSYTLTVTGTPLAPTAGTVPRTLRVVLLVRGSLAVHVQGIEVTQATQSVGQPFSAAYTGVPLVMRKKTVVRVYAGFSGAEAVTPGVPRRPPLGMVLTGLDAAGRTLPFGPVLPEWSPPVDGLPVGDGTLRSAERLSPTAAYTFTLPGTWSKRGPITLVAQAVAGGSPLGTYANRYCDQPGCGAVPVARLSGIGFVRTPAPWVLNLVAQIGYDPPTGAVTMPSPTAATLALAKLLALSPVPFRFLMPDGTSLTSTPVLRAVRYAPNNALLEDAQAYDTEIGSAGDGTAGLFNSEKDVGVTVGRVSTFSTDRDAAGVRRPVTLAAHEVLHQLALGHADSDSSCGGRGDGLPDARGHLASVGLDTSTSPPYTLYTDTPAVRNYDLMSYCGIPRVDSVHWISTLNWNRLLAAARTTSSRSAAAAPAALVASAAGGLEVLGSDGPAGVRITSVGAAGPAPAPAPGATPYRLVARDVAGRVLADVPMPAARAVDGPVPATLLRGRVAAAGAARVEIAVGGVVVAGRDRSANAPAVRVLRPRTGARLAPGRPVTVRWRASDRDGDALRAVVEASSDGGRRYSAVWAGPADGVARLPAGLLRSSPRTVLRVRVDDGFRAATARSGVVAVASAAPRVAILQPSRGGVVAGGATVYLEGAATDDRGRAVTGARLRWVAAGRVVARGVQATAVLPPGIRGVRLVATDARGRSGTATVPIRSRGSTPYLLRTGAPRSLPRTARRVTMRVVATQPALLRVAGRTVAVGPRVTAVRVPVRPGRTPLVLRLVLTAGGARGGTVLRIPRR